MAVAARFPLPPEREGHPRQTRHRDAETPHRDLHQRLFLARARRVRQIRDAEIECRVLAIQNLPQPRTRPQKLQNLAGKRLERDRCLGMRAEIILFRRDDGKRREISYFSLATLDRKIYLIFNYLSYNYLFLIFQNCPLGRRRCLDFFNNFRCL